MRTAKKYTADDLQERLDQARADVRFLMQEFTEGAVRIIQSFDAIEIGVLGDEEEAPRKPAARTA